MGFPISRLIVVLAAASSLPAGSACNDSSEYHAPGPLPQIVNVNAPATVNCAPECTGGACPLSVGVSFRLPPEEFVRGVKIRFQRDGSDFGVDRIYPIEPLFGVAEGTLPIASVAAAVPESLVGTGSLFTYSVRLFTGRGDDSEESTLTLSVTSNGNEECRKRNQGEPVDQADAGGGQ